VTSRLGDIEQRFNESIIFNDVWVTAGVTVFTLVLLC